MLQPTVYVLPLRVMMCPVDYAALVIPLVLAVKHHRIACAQSDNARRKIDIVCDQKRASCIQSKDEALMSAAVRVVRQYADHFALAADLLS